MKGLTFEQYKEVVNFVQKHHKFGYVKEKNQIKKDWHLHIKYIDNCYDTRFNNIWSVSFRGLGQEINFRTNSLSNKLIPMENKFDNLLDWIMAYLKGELTENEIKHFK